MAPMAMRVTEMGASESCPVIGQTEVASPRGDKITSDLCGRSKAVKSGFIDTKLPGGRLSLWAFTPNQRRSTLPLMI